MKQLFFPLAFSFCLSGTSWAGDIVEELPAGGVYIFQAKDKYTIKCTSDPIEPKVLSKSCGCFGTSGFRPFRLKMKALLSNGKVVENEVSNADSMLECEKKLAEQYGDLCKVK